VIKDDIFQAFNSLWSLDFHSFFLTNQAYMVLLRKRQVAEEVKDYRPISLIHCFSKLFAKCLLVRLAFQTRWLPHFVMSARTRRQPLIRSSPSQRQCFRPLARYQSPTKTWIHLKHSKPHCLLCGGGLHVNSVGHG
jgi:hypothetical protein